MKATIQNAKILGVNQIWKKHKPQGLGFSDTDVIVLRLKPDSGRVFAKSFYCRLKADGTLGRSSTKASEKRQQVFRNFLASYISKNKRYNIRENLDKWKGKKIEVEKVDNNLIIVTKWGE